MFYLLDGEVYGRCWRSVRLGGLLDVYVDGTVLLRVVIAS